MRLIKGKILSKLLFAVIPVSALSLIVALALANYYMRKTVDSYVPSSNMKTADIVALRISGILKEAKVSLESVSDTLVQERYVNKRSYLLRQILLKNSFFRYIALVDRSGMEIANTNIDGLLDENKRWEGLPKVIAGNVSFSEVYLSRDDIPTVAVCLPCVKWRKINSAVCGEIDFRTIWTEMDNASIGKTGYSVLVTQDGRYLSHPDKAKVLKLETLDKFEISSLSGEEGSYFIGIKSETLATFSTVPGANWKVIVMQDKEEVFRNYMLMKKYLLITTLLLVVLTTILLTIFSRNITRPIEELTKATEKIAAGDLNYSIDLTPDNEIGALAVSFNKMMDDLKKHQMMLVQTEKLSSLGRFAASVAHEIQNPISGLLGYTYLLKKHDDPKTVEFANDMEEELQNIQSVVESLLSLSKKTDYKFEEISLNDVVRKSVELLDHHFNRFKKIGINTKLDDNIPSISGNKTLLQQALLNIVLNSGEALGEDGVIEISSKHRSGEVSIIISDNGPGISESNIEKLFEPFFTTKQGSGGTGLGLYITSEIMKLHRGKINVKSEKGNGTEFSLTFFS